MNRVEYYHAPYGVSFSELIADADAIYMHPAGVRGTAYQHACVARRISDVNVHHAD